MTPQEGNAEDVSCLARLFQHIADVRLSEQLGSRWAPVIIVLSRGWCDDTDRGDCNEIAYSFLSLAFDHRGNYLGQLASTGATGAVFVSVNGNDSNPCTALSPCRTFQAAHNAVQAGGEIDVLDTGGYGPLSITKSISIVNPGGVVASIATSGSVPAIQVNAGSGDSISLRGLTLDGGGLASSGIDFTGGGNLEIADCVVRKYSLEGLYIHNSGASTLKVTNSEFNDNGNWGIVVQPNNGPVLGTLDHVGFYNNNQVGFLLENNLPPGGLALNFTVKDSVASNNLVGFQSVTNVDNTASRLMLVRSVVSNNSQGIISFGTGSQVIVDESTIFNNAHAWQADGGGFIFSHGNNSVEGNAADFGPVTPAAALE